MKSPKRIFYLVITLYAVVLGKTFAKTCASGVEVNSGFASFLCASYLRQLLEDYDVRRL